MPADPLELELARHFVEAHPDDAARVLEAMEPAATAQVIDALSAEETADLFRFLPPFVAARSLARLEVASAAEHMSTPREDVAAAVLRATEPTFRASVLGALEAPRRRTLEQLLRYRDGTAGALLDPRVLTIPEGLSVGEALDRVRSNPERALYYVYIVAGENELSGVVTLRQLMLAESDEPVASIATRSVHALRAEAGRDAILAHPGWHRVPTLPVVDDRGRLLGVVRYESAQQLEHDLGAEALRDPTRRTAAALGELYGVGVRGLLALGQSLVARQDPRSIEEGSS